MAGEWEDVVESDDGWENVPADSGGPKSFQIPKLAPQQSADEMNREMAADMPWYQSLMVATGREMDKMAVGTADLWDKGKEKWGYGIDDSREVRAKNEAAKDREYGILSDEQPIATMAGTVLPYLATLPLSVAGGTTRGAPMAANLLKTPGKDLLKMLSIDTGIGGVQGAAHYDDTAAEGALWGLGGSMGGKVVGDILGGKPNALVGDENTIVKYAKDNGLFTPPGMATGNRALQQMDQALKTHRNTAGKFAQRMDDNNVVQNNMVSKELGGKPTDYFTVDYLSSELDRISGNFNQLAKDSSGEILDDDALKIGTIIGDFMDTSIDSNIPAVMKNAENKAMDIFDNRGGQITGDVYQNVTGNLRKRATEQYKTGDKLLAKSLDDIAKVYDDIIERSGTVPIDQWKSARKEYALHSAINKSTDVAGNIIPRRLASNFKSSDTINKLATVDQLRKNQPGSSLSTSSLLGNILKSGDAGSAVGGMSLLSGRALGGVLPLLEDVTTSLYLSGYPHVSGLMGNWAGKASEKAIPRLLMGDGE